jgi:hypothetical protein
VDFCKARDLFGIIFQIPGPNCKIMDCGLISKKPRGLNAKCWKLEFPGIIFLKETRGGAGPDRPNSEENSFLNKNYIFEYTKALS